MAMSSTDLATIASLQAEYAKRKAAGDNQTDLDALHAGAEGIRSKYGISGGVDGSQNASIASSSNSGLQSATSQSDYLNSLYAAKQQSQVDALKSAYEANTTDLNASAAKIPDTYNTARNATAATSAQNQAGFNERAAASGLNNGAGGQASLSMANTLSGNLSSLDKQQANALTDIETQRTKYAQQYNTAIQQAMADNDTAKATALYNEAFRVDNSLASTSQAQAQLAQNQQSIDLNKQSTQASDANTEYEKKLAKAETQAKYGIFTGYLDLGYSQADVDAMKANYDTQNAAKMTSTSSGGSGRSSGSSSSASNPYADTPAATATDANGVVLDETSPYGIINDIETLRSQGMSNADIKAYAKQATLAGQISGSQYQMYVQYSG